MSLTMTHFSHGHKLALRCSQRLFTCNGCKELGFGACYQCEQPNCSYFLHDVCAEASPLAFHPFFSNITFKLHSKFSDQWNTSCDACGKLILGVLYSSPGPYNIGTINLHPVCLKLKYVLQNDDGLTLHLRDKVSYSGYHLSSILRKKCQHCKSIKVCSYSKGWAYVSSDGTYRYHVGCVRDMMYDKWKTSYLQGNMNSSSSLSPLSVMPSTSQTGVVQHNNSSSSSMPTVLKMSTVVIRLIISATFGEPTGVFFAATQLMGNN